MLLWRSVVWRLDLGLASSFVLNFLISDGAWWGVGHSHHFSIVMLYLNFFKSLIRNGTLCRRITYSLICTWCCWRLLFLLVFILHHWFIRLEVLSNPCIDGLFPKSVVVRSLYFDHVLHLRKVNLISSNGLWLHRCGLLDVASRYNTHPVIFEILFRDPGTLHLAVLLLLLATRSVVWLEISFLGRHWNLLGLWNLANHREAPGVLRSRLTRGPLGGGCLLSTLLAGLVIVHYYKI